MDALQETTYAAFLCKRKAIRKEILSLSRQRTEYIAAEQHKRNCGVQNGFDVAVSAALRQQLAKKGIKYWTAFD